MTESRTRTGWMAPATVVLLAIAVMFALLGCATTPPGPPTQSVSVSAVVWERYEFIEMAYAIRDFYLNETRDAAARCEKPANMGKPECVEFRARDTAVHAFWEAKIKPRMFAPDVVVVAQRQGIDMQRLMELIGVAAKFAAKAAI